MANSSAKVPEVGLPADPARGGHVDHGGTRRHPWHHPLDQVVPAHEVDQHRLEVGERGAGEPGAVEEGVDVPLDPVGGGGDRVGVEEVHLDGLVHWTRDGHAVQAHHVGAELDQHVDCGRAHARGGSGHHRPLARNPSTSSMSAPPLLLPSPGPRGAGPPDRPQGDRGLGTGPPEVAARAAVPVPAPSQVVDGVVRQTLRTSPRSCQTSRRAVRASDAWSPTVDRTGRQWAARPPGGGAWSVAKARIMFSCTKEATRSPSSANTWARP